MDNIYISALLRKAKKDINNSNELSIAILSEINSAMKEAEYIACHKGCSHCCYLRVFVYDYELVSIQNYMDNKMFKKQSDEIISSVKIQYEKVKNMTMEEHHRTNIKCPFLINDTCSIYPVRPVSCAGYHSLSEQVCRKSYDDPFDDSFGIPLNINIDKVKKETHFFIQMNVEKNLEEQELITGMHEMLNDKNRLKDWRGK